MRKRLQQHMLSASLSTSPKPPVSALFTHEPTLTFAQLALGAHRSDAEQRIAKVPVIEVEGTTAVCDGGGGALGHPIEYIQLNTRKPDEPCVCKYCGLRFVMKPH
jgi:NADH dehydrogenase (ubiquinone) Fe-S protein 6